MIKAIQQFFTQSLQPQPEKKSDDTLHLAAAALMIELIYIDENVTKSERTQLVHLLEEIWHIDKKHIDHLVKMAEKEVDNAHDLYQFTRLINDSYPYQLKCQLIESLWQLAYADDDLNKYEESMIRKMADLLYVTHADFIRSKQAAMTARHSLQN